MYTVPSDWFAHQVDWLQLGCMIAYCLQDGITDYHHMTVCDQLKRDVFVGGLIEGVTNSIHS